MSLADLNARHESERSPHTALLGSEFVGWDEASLTVTMRFKVKREVCTWRGGVQGGLVAGYLDDVMGYSYVLASGGTQAPLNLDLNMTLIRLIPEGATIIGKGRVVKAGQRVIFLEGELLGKDGTLYARATSTAIPTPMPTPQVTGLER